MKIAFLHPDLGLGGAERLVVDAGVALQERGHQVSIFTSHHDPARCFEETRDGTLDVRVLGDFLPSHTADRWRAPSAILRMLYIAARVRLLQERFDLFFCDLVAHTVPALKLLSPTPVLFYCHYPDRLLATQRGGLYRAYRWPIDWCEERCMALADKVLVNSQFTAQVLANTLPLVGAAEVVYPGVRSSDRGTGPSPLNGAVGAETFSVLCFSRFERKKNVQLAIDALVVLRTLLPAESFARVRLVIAGGYDARLRDNREVSAQLEQHARDAGLGAQVSFVRSPSDAQRDALVQGCQCLIFTAENEHFGYVPVEAMAAGKPVIAAASGGPLETVQDGETGFLCAPEPALFAQRLAQLAQQPELRQRLGDNGRRRVEQLFSRRAFGGRLGSIVESIAASGTPT